MNIGIIDYFANFRPNVAGSQRMVTSFALVTVPCTLKTFRGTESGYVNASVIRASETANFDIGVIETCRPFLNELFPFVGAEVSNTGRLCNRQSSVDMSGRRRRSTLLWFYRLHIRIGNHTPAPRTRTSLGAVWDINAHLRLQCGRRVQRQKFAALLARSALSTLQS